MTSTDSKAQERDLVTAATYDETPYESYAFPLTHPEHQALVGRLMGLEPPPVQTARVLELGCAGGGNILPLAHDYPEAEFYAIDLSPVQIEEAKAHAKGLGLKNITFETLDIMDLDPKKHGTFDYIICHGVFSWVPDFVREKILTVCKEHLTPNGLACISYNVLPGWGPLRSVREMMILHTRKTTDQKEKIRQAKIFLKFLNDFMPPDSNLLPTIRSTHQKLESTTNDSYIFHEFLEPNNYQLYFTEFNDLLIKNNLQYAGDSSLIMMNAGNLAKDVQTSLQRINDTASREQYIDFLSNRQFRHSIIATSNAQQNANGIDNLENLFFCCELETVTPDALNAPTVRFKRPNANFEMELQSSFLSKTLVEMSKTPHTFYSLDEVCEIAASFDAQSEPDALRKAVKSNLVILLFKDALAARTTSRTIAQTPSEKPKSYGYARYQASLQDTQMVTNINAKAVKVSELHKALLILADGTKTKADLADALYAHQEKNNIPVMDGKKPVTDPKKIKAHIRKATPQILENFQKLGLLVS